MARNHTRESKKLKEADKGPGARGQESLRREQGEQDWRQKLLMSEKYRVCKTSLLQKQLNEVHSDF